MFNNLDSIVADLSEEEKALLEKIQQKFLETAEQAKQEKLNNTPDDESEDVSLLDFSKNHPEIIHPKHVTVAPHEITVCVKADVSTVDSKGYLSEVVDILEKYYHIPVKAKDDYKVYLERFFDAFHKALETTCQDLNSFKKES